ncbi:MAG: hypothetical protein CSYNP_03589 [Syntrophus sp. SKADARSKE-3]|nr:hypothetical protein [Syntrophus sp. SKADARSKE-3]
MLQKIKLYVTVLFVAPLFLLNGCTASKLDLHVKNVHGGTQIPQQCFNEYQYWFEKSGPTKAKYDNTITVRVRAFGKQADKAAAWNNEHFTKHPDWGPLKTAAAVPADPIEIWMDLMEDGQGNLVLPPHVLGHVMEHALIMYEKRTDLNRVTDLFDVVTAPKQIIADAVVPKQCFSNYQKWFNSLYPTDKKVDIKLTIRIRAFGQGWEKQENWDRDWRKKHPDWGPASAGITVSGNPIEIWMDLKQDDSGNLIMPPHVLGHEMEHAIIIYDDRVENPHLRFERYIYERK